MPHCWRLSSVGNWNKTSTLSLADMNSEDIQDAVYGWARAHGFTAPYGVLSSTAKSKAGKSYRSVTFGYARTRDIEVQIYNRNFIILRDSRNRGNNTVFKSYTELMNTLTTL